MDERPLLLLLPISNPPFSDNPTPLLLNEARVAGEQLVVARGEGYGQKREMTLASPTESALAPHRIKYRP